MSCKSSPSNESNAIPSSSSRSTLPLDDTLSRDFSLASIASSGASQQDEYYHCADHADTTMRNMQAYLENKQLCDVILIAGIDDKR